MAIEITQAIEGIYPAYNDGYIHFSSSLIDSDYAEVIAVGINNDDPIKLYSIDDNYIFNVADFVKTAIDAGTFNDQLEMSDKFVEEYPEGYLRQIFRLSIHKGSEEELFFVPYLFYRGVVQSYESIPYQSNTKLELTYWRGFPFDFGIRYLENGDSIHIDSQTSGVEYNHQVLIDNSYRIVVDTGDNYNWNTERVMPLKEGLNHLSISSDNENIYDLDITQKRKVNGNYIKFFDSHTGFYSYHLFDEYFDETITGESSGRISTNSFGNIGSKINEFKEVKKTGGKSIILKTRANRSDAKKLKRILTSPSVELYTSTRPDIKGDWIDVSVQGSITIPNKRDTVNISITVNLPETKTVGI